MESSPLDLYLRWEAEPGAVYRIEVSSHLEHWTVHSHALSSLFHTNKFMFGLTEPYFRMSRR